MAGLTSKDYDYYRASAGGDLPTIGSEIVKELHEPWWTEPRFATNRETYGEGLQGRESALKAETCAYLSEATSQLPKGGLRKELDLGDGSAFEMGEGGLYLRLGPVRASEQIRTSEGAATEAEVPFTTHLDLSPVCPRQSG
jgi:hypothetical protein